MGVRFMRVVEFIRGRWVHSGSPSGSLGSSWVVGFTQVRPWLLWVHPWWHSSTRSGSLGSSWIIGRHMGRCVYSKSVDSLGCALGVVGLNRGR